MDCFAIPLVAENTNGLKVECSTSLMRCGRNLANYLFPPSTQVSSSIPIKDDIMMESKIRKERERPGDFSSSGVYSYCGQHKPRMETG